MHSVSKRLQIGKKNSPNIKDLEKIVKILYPIPRSILGKGFRESLRLLQDHIGLELSIKKENKIKRDLKFLLNCLERLQLQQNSEQKILPATQDLEQPYKLREKQICLKKTLLVQSVSPKWM